MATDDQTQGEPEEPTELVRHLRGLLKERDENAAAGRAAVRELAFVKAGIDTSTKLGQLFAKSYEGDVNDVEALKAEAKELGLFKDPAETTDEKPTEPASEPTPTDTSAQERSNLANGAAGDDGTGVDPIKSALDVSTEAMKRGARWEEAAGGFINQLARAAVQGDPRVLVPERKSA